jgi:UDP-glucose 4-epimerase
MLVSGGAGFIGSHLVDRLVAEGHRVTVVDDLSHGRAENLRAALATGDCELVKVDLAEPGLPAAVAAAQPEVVFNLAAQIDVRVSVAEPVRDAAVNVLGTVALLEAARRAGARKVVHASSVAIYGPPGVLPVTEETPARPLSPYAVSKLTGELYLRAYHDLYGLETATLVLTNTYGPRQDPHGEAGVVAIFAEAMLAGRPTQVFGDGGNTRDYLYVDDAVDAFVRCAAMPVKGRRLVLGTGVATTDLELHRMVARAVGGDAEPEFAPPRLGDLPHMMVDATAAQAELRWVPRTALAEGVALTVAGMREGRLS